MPPASTRAWEGRFDMSNFELSHTTGKAKINCPPFHRAFRPVAQSDQLIYPKKHNGPTKPAGQKQWRSQPQVRIAIGSAALGIAR